jgi:hypothetical protein
MVTRWSRHHDELYLGQKRLLCEVEDVEGLKAVLWLRGIGQWRSGLVVYTLTVTVHLWSPLARWRR